MMFGLKRSFLALTFGIAVCSVAAPALAQPSQREVSGARAQALRACSNVEGRFAEHSWGDREIESVPRLHDAARTARIAQRGRAD